MFPPQESQHVLVVKNGFFELTLPEPEPLKKAVSVPVPAREKPLAHNYLRQQIKSQWDSPQWQWGDWQVGDEWHVPRVSRTGSQKSQILNPPSVLSAVKTPEPGNDTESKTPTSKLQCTYYINIHDDVQFKVAKRILGPKGWHLKRISQALRGTRLRLRGDGSNPNPKSGSSGPLHLRLTAGTESSLHDGKKMIEGVLAPIYREYSEFTGVSTTFTLVDGPEK